jgi:hypothetical protein
MNNQEVPHVFIVQRILVSSYSQFRITLLGKIYFMSEFCFCEKIKRKDESEVK